MIRAFALVVALSAGAAAQVPASRAEPVRLGHALDPLGGPTEVGQVAVLEPPGDEWIARDKALHLGASFLLTLAGQYVLTDKTDWSNWDALPVAAGAALALGLAKEVADSQREVGPHFCWRDLAADAAGVALAAAVVAL